MASYVGDAGAPDARKTWDHLPPPAESEMSARARSGLPVLRLNHRLKWTYHLCPTQHPARYTRVLRPDNSWQVPRGCALPRLRAQVQRQNPEKLCVPPVGVNAAAVVKPTVDCCQKYSAALGQIPTDAEFTPMTWRSSR